MADTNMDILKVSFYAMYFHRDVKQQIKIVLYVN